MITFDFGGCHLAMLNDKTGTELTAAGAAAKILFPKPELGKERYF